MKITNFKQLNSWQQSHFLVLTIYKISSTFPKQEQFGLTNQIRRAAVSITSNIAEGFSRQSFKEKIQFYAIAQGSVTELQNQLLIARDVGFITKDDFFVVTNPCYVAVGTLFEESKVNQFASAKGLTKDEKPQYVEQSRWELASH